MDTLLSEMGWVYYPEEEYRIHNMRPPDTQPLAAAWRNINARIFVFLLGSAGSKAGYLVIVTGTGEDTREEVTQIGRRITSHKEHITRLKKRERDANRFGRKLERETRRKPVTKFGVIIGIFVAVINALSLYLRHVDTPQFDNNLARQVYVWLVAAVHIMAIAFLLLIIFFGMVYTVRYAIMMLRSGR